MLLPQLPPQELSRGLKCGKEDFDRHWMPHKVSCVSLGVSGLRRAKGDSIPGVTWPNPAWCRLCSMLGATSLQTAREQLAYLLFYYF